MMGSRIYDPIQSIGADIAEGYYWLFLDAFDTLLWRQCLWPTDIFKKLAENCRFPHLTAWHRKLSERISYLRSPNPTYERVFNGFFAWTIDQEYAAERDEIRANPFFLRALNRFGSELRLVVLSDMYMSSVQISDLLDAAGYNLDSFHAIFSSADINATKYNGTAFTSVAQRLDAPFRRIVHYGDNPHSDFHRPTSLGLKARIVYCPRTWALEHRWPLPRSLAWSESQLEGLRLNNAFIRAVESAS